MLYFNTGDPEVSGILNSLAYSAESHQSTDSPETLQHWLVGVIERIEKLPEKYRTAINIHNFHVGDRHFNIPMDQVQHMSEKLINDLNTGLLAAKNLD